MPLIPHARSAEFVRHAMQASEQAERRHAELMAPYLAPPKEGSPSTRPKLKPLELDARSGNELRPQTFDQMVGQDRVKGFMRRIITVAKQTGRPLDHMLLSGASGQGKTTLAQVVAHELGRRVFQVSAPVDFATFEELRTVCRDGDVLVVDELHQQCSGDRRGVTSGVDQETFYAVMEDRRLSTPTGTLPFAAITVIGCTTDSGLLSAPFLNRFPLTPTLDHYTVEEMATLARANATALGLTVTDEAALMFGRAARRTPRQLNTYVRNARSLGVSTINADLAREVICDLNSTTLDGLNADMVNMMRFLLKSRRESKGAVIHQAAVGTIATALGKSRDQKSIALYVEPWLIEVGYVAVTHGGRQLTDVGIQRAQAL
jgi:Holliday junction DNA helicase RuvB